MKKIISAALCVILCFILSACAQVKNDNFTSTCTLEIECKTVLENMDKLNKDKAEVIPEDGVILSEEEFGFSDGESVYDVLRRVCTEKKIHLDASVTPGFNTAYVKGINNLYEFDCGEASGWTYSVNGKSPSFGCSDYTLTQGDKIVFHYICEFTDEF